mgnify:CR=1 FL=1
MEGSLSFRTNLDCECVSPLLVLVHVPYASVSPLLELVHVPMLVLSVDDILCLVRVVSDE